MRRQFAEGHGCQVLGGRDYLEQYRPVIGNLLQQQHDLGVLFVHQEGVVPLVDHFTQCNRFDVPEIHDHAIGRVTGFIDHITGEGDFHGVTMPVQVTALAAVIRDAVAGVKLQPASNAHDFWQFRSKSSGRLYHCSMSDPKPPADSVSKPDPAQPVRWLTFSDHDPDFLNLTYVYPVLSRRMRGISIGINLNTNNACNWACAYCQVPGLHRGEAPEVNLGLLEAELRGLLDNPGLSPMIPPDTPEPMRQIRDIAFSGNGEPTSSPQFAEAVEIARRQRDAHGLDIPLVLITNGSLMLRPEVQAGVKALAEAGGVVWFKVDRLLPDSMKQINGISYKPEQIQHRLDVACSFAPIWLQTCWLAWDGQAPDAADEAAYLEFVLRNRDQIQGVHLYGLARPSLQPEAPHLTALSEAAMNAWAERIRSTGVTVQVSL